jgi:hypothetical protein
MLLISVARQDLALLTKAMAAVVLSVEAIDTNDWGVRVSVDGKTGGDMRRALPMKPR